MKEAQPFERASKPLPLKDIIFNNFVGGIAWALGATVGISLIFTLLALLAKNVNLIPIVGEFVSEIINFVLSHNTRL